MACSSLGVEPELLASVQEISKSDIVLLVIGMTGTCKSTFINIASACDLLTVGYGLISITSSVQMVRYSHPKEPNKKIVLVDTPGFGHSTMSELDVLERIASFLRELYLHGNYISGIIYLCRYLDGSNSVTQRNAKTVEQLCGRKACHNLVIAGLEVGTSDSQRTGQIAMLRELNKRLLELGSQFIEVNSSDLASATQNVIAALLHNPVPSRSPHAPLLI